MTGNIAAGAMMGSVGDPAGAAAGALGGLLLWVAREVVGGLIDRAFGEEDEIKEHKQKMRKKMRKKMHEKDDEKEDI